MRAASNAGQGPEGPRERPSRAAAGSYGPARYGLCDGRIAQHGGSGKCVRSSQFETTFSELTMTGFTKLFSSILTSTIWREDLPTKVVWVTMLALADRDGIVEASIPGLAHSAGATVEQTEAALTRFLSPDPYSRSPQHGGRRVEAIDGGWRLLNYDKYRAKMSLEDIRERDRIRKQRQRERQRGDCPTKSGTERDKAGMSHEVQHSEAEAEAEAEKASERNTGRAAGWTQSSDIGKEPLDMLDAFASVGACSFDVTTIDIKGVKLKFKRNLSLAILRHTIGRTLQEARGDQHNVIVRPRSTTATLVQLDDLDAEKATQIAPYAFMIICTSPGNHQVWVAVKDAPQDFARRLRKGTGSDPTASGATRIAGSLNFKSEYAPDFPLVEITNASTGNVITAAELEACGFVAAPEESRPHSQRNSPRRWPDYQRCVQGAPPIHNGDRPDISRADFTWCRTAIAWGWSVEETATRLMGLSGKAKENGKNYALTTAKNAADAF